MKTVRYDVIDSTNEEARRMIAAGETGPCWIVAAEQTAGRGRRGRKWISERDNLFATVIVSPPAPLERRAQLSFVAGLAAADTVALYAEYQNNISLKWPNDVLIWDKKVGGILLESFGNSVAVGFGINLSPYPTDTEFPATGIGRESSGTPEVDDFLSHLVKDWDAWYEVWTRDGFAPVRAAWLARASGLGERIRVRLMDREMEGLFEDLDEYGALLLRQADGALVRVTAGDVFFGT